MLLERMCACICMCGLFRVQITWYLFNNKVSVQLILDHLSHFYKLLHKNTNINK